MSAYERARFDALNDNRPKTSLGLREYVRQAWHVVEPATPFVPGWHIDAICEHLEAVSAGEIRRLIINIPFRCAKSLLVAVFWPTWEWTQRPHRRFLAASYAQPLSTRDAVKSRRLIQSPWYQSRWGGTFALTGDQNEKMRYDNDRAGYRIATSVGGVATGEGGDIRILDDPHKPQEAQSDVVRNADIEWLKETWSSRFTDPKTSAEVVVMQRLHQRDATGYYLSEVGGYEHLRIPMRFEESHRCVTVLGWEDPRQEAGELMWPERFGETEVAKIEKDLGSYGAAGQLQQRPSPAGGGILKKEWFRFYTVAPAHFDEIIQSWDMSFKETRSGSYVAGHIWGRVGANKYLLDRVHRRMNFPDTKRAVKLWAVTWPEARLKLVEDKANGPAIIDDLCSEVAGLVAVPVEGSKEARMHAVSPGIEAGNVYLPHPQIAPWINDLLESFASFPFGAHDDDEDAMSQALLRLQHAWPTGDSSLDVDEGAIPGGLSGGVL